MGKDKGNKTDGEYEKGKGIDIEHCVIFLSTMSIIAIDTNSVPCISPPYYKPLLVMCIDSNVSFKYHI